MKLLITGGSGFIGSHMIQRLKGEHDVYALLRYTTGRYVLGELKDVKTLFGDLRDASRVKEIIRYVQPDAVIHLAAISAQSYSYGHPIETLETNFMGTVNLSEACYRLIPHFKHFLMAGCYSEDTKALTMEGWKSGEQIQEGDLVLSLNPIDKRIEWKLVKKVVRKYYSGPMIHFLGKRVDLLVTPNHRMLIENEKYGQIQVEQATETANRSVCWLPNGIWEQTVPTFDVRGLTNIETIDFDIGDFFYVVGLYIAEGHSDIQTKEFLTKTDLTQRQYALAYQNDRGRFIAVKHTTPKKKLSRTFRVFFANQQEGVRSKLFAILKKNGIPVQLERRCIFSSSEKLYRWLNGCGHSAPTKTIPRWMLESEWQYLERLYEGLIDGDGSRRRGREILYTSSELLATRFIELCIKLGFNVTVGLRKEREGKIGSRVVKANYPQFAIYISHKSKGLYKKNAKIVSYTGYIWCPVVEDNHSLLVERNGRVTFCGNTAEEYSVQSHFPIKESARLGAQSPYAVSKVASDYYLRYLHEGYEFPVTVMRGFNTYGRKRNRHFLVERVVTQMLEGGDVRLGDPDPVIDWMHVSDHVEGYVSALEQPEKAIGETFNLSTGVGTSIKDLALKVAELTGWKGTIVWHTVPKRPVRVTKLVGDPSKAWKMLGWKAEVGLEEGLCKTIDYWKTK